MVGIVGPNPTPTPAPRPTPNPNPKRCLPLSPQSNKTVHIHMNSIHIRVPSIGEDLEQKTNKIISCGMEHLEEHPSEWMCLNGGYLILNFN